MNRRQQQQPQAWDALFDPTMLPAPRQPNQDIC